MIEVSDSLSVRSRIGARSTSKFDELPRFPTTPKSVPVKSGRKARPGMGWTRMFTMALKSFLGASLSRSVARVWYSSTPTKSAKVSLSFTFPALRHSSRIASRTELSLSASALAGMSPTKSLYLSPFPLRKKRCRSRHAKTASAGQPFSRSSNALPLWKRTRRPIFGSGILARRRGHSSARRVFPVPDSAEQMGILCEVRSVVRATVAVCLSWRLANAASMEDTASSRPTSGNASCAGLSTRGALFRVGPKGWIQRRIASGDDTSATARDCTAALPPAMTRG